MLFLCLSSVIKIHSQCIELYGGYFNRLKPVYGENRVRNFNNGSAGIGGNVYIRSVAIHVGIGYMSENYQIDYVYSSSSNDEILAKVSNYSINGLLMVYPKLYADGKNVLSMGAGANFMFPRRMPHATIRYEDGTIKQAKSGGFYRTVAPRIAVRYTRVFAQSFLFFTDLYSDITPMQSFVQGSSGESSPPIPYYWSWASLGLNVGVGYVIPTNGVKMPRYFYKKVKKEIKKT